MTTMNDIRNDLIKVFNALRDGTMDAKDAFEINNTAGKIISSAKVQLAYCALRQERPNISFLNGDDSFTNIALPDAKSQLEAH